MRRRSSSCSDSKRNITLSQRFLLDPEGGSQNATLVVLLLVVLGISSLKIRAHMRDLPSQMFKLISN